MINSTIFKSTVRTKIPNKFNKILEQESSPTHQAALFKSSDKKQFLQSKTSTLSSELWQACMNEELHITALESKFIQGIKHSKLEPANYGIYFFQDAVYCAKASEVYSIAFRRASYMYKQGNLPEGIKEFIEERAKTYEEYAKNMLKLWCINQPSAVALSKAAKDYIDFEFDVTVLTSTPLYLLVASLPCLKLWNWLANELKEHATNNNIYKNWIEENLDGSSLVILEDFLNKKANFINKEEAKIIYKQAMICECNFFLSATEQNLIKEYNEERNIANEFIKNNLEKSESSNKKTPN